MSINAQLAQNSKLYIAGTSSSALNLVSITVGYPTILTFLNATVATALKNGDYAAIAGVTGTGNAALNTNAVVSHKSIGVTNTTFTVDIDTSALTLTGTSATATPAAWVQVNEIKGIKPSGASASKIDVTDLNSTAKEYRTGLVDNGTFSCDVFILESDPGQAAVLAAFTASTVNQYKVVTPAKTRTFSASCLKWPTIPDASVDGVQTGSADFVVSGTVVVS
jgi:hypothetical protein